ncbi:hypothetical protein MYXO_02163 [Myxococcaceae bacterium]|nr:hypothetical protein MYXO_02163 [Myxococcaceae bacterium]
MATRENNLPYAQFNFQVGFDSGDALTARAGFQEVSGIGMEVGVAEYRTGNAATNNVTKITGLNKSSDVTLKRGVIGALDLYAWLDDVRNGNRGTRAVTIQLKTETAGSQTPVLTWQLHEARIIKYTCGPLNAKSNEIAMEELVLAYERLTME